MTECNQVFLVGSSGNVDVGTTRAGAPVANLMVIICDAPRNWVHVKAFGHIAEHARDNVRKDSKVFVEGALGTDRWTDSDGKKRLETMIIASRISVVPIPLFREESSPSESGKVDISQCFSGSANGGKIPEPHQSPEEAS